MKTQVVLSTEPHRWTTYGAQLKKKYTWTMQPLLQILCFKAATGNALTIFLAGLALTFTILPKISLLPAFVAGFVRILSLAKPGIVKTPAFFTFAVATSANLSRRPAHCDFLSSAPAAKASAIAPFDIALTPD